MCSERDISPSEGHLGVKGHSKPNRSKLATSKGPSELMDTSGSHDPLHDDGASRDDDAEGHFNI